MAKTLGLTRHVNFINVHETDLGRVWRVRPVGGYAVWTGVESSRNVQCILEPSAN